MRHLALAIALLPGVVCDRASPDLPRVSSAAESMWLLVDFQLRIDALRPLLFALQGRSYQLTRLDDLSDEIEQTADQIEAATSQLELKAARYRADLIGVTLDVIRVHAQATAHGVGGVLNRSCTQAMQFLDDARRRVRTNRSWPIEAPEEADRLLDHASIHVANAMRAAPVASFMKTGVEAAAMANAASSLVQLTQAVRLGLGRMAAFMRSAGVSEARLATAFQGGTGALQLSTSGDALVITTSEAIALAKEGIVSAAALQLLFRATHVHHIATNKNIKSDAAGGPWTPQFEKLFERAGMTLDDEANLVQVQGHQGPHPETYHREVYNRPREASRGLKAGTPELRQALLKTLRELAKEIQTPGTQMNRWVTGVAR